MKSVGLARECARKMRRLVLKPSSRRGLPGDPIIVVPCPARPPASALTEGSLVLHQVAADLNSRSVCRCQLPLCGAPDDRADLWWCELGDMFPDAGYMPVFPNLRPDHAVATTSTRRAELTPKWPGMSRVVAFLAETRHVGTPYVIGVKRCRLQSRCLARPVSQLLSLTVGHSGKKLILTVKHGSENEKRASSTLDENLGKTCTNSVNGNESTCGDDWSWILFWDSRHMEREG